MRLLLDTHVVLWELSGARTVSARAREAIEQAGELLFSVASFAEIGVKASVGKLSVPASLHDHLLSSGVRVLGLDAEHGLRVAELPLHHRDPFDRLLIAQAIAEQLAIVTADRRFAAYGVPVIDAS
ncbi:MAG: type II toxin-antitoxin system VapC family toxin [Solirubrobacteraceae bacterium]